MLKATLLGCSWETSRLPVPVKLPEGNFERLKFRKKIKFKNKTGKDIKINVNQNGNIKFSEIIDNI